MHKMLAEHITPHENHVMTDQRQDWYAADFNTTYCPAMWTSYMDFLSTEMETFWAICICFAY